MGAIKIIKVIGYIGDYYILFGDGKPWSGIVFISPGGQFSHRYVIPVATRHISPKLTESARLSFLLFQDGVSLACSFPPST